MRTDTHKCHNTRNTRKGHLAGWTEKTGRQAALLEEMTSKLMSCEPGKAERAGWPEGCREPGAGLTLGDGEVTPGTERQGRWPANDENRAVGRMEPKDERCHAER